jgi:hypothetical protein
VGAVRAAARRAGARHRADQRPAMSSG